MRYTFFTTLIAENDDGAECNDFVLFDFGAGMCGCETLEDKRVENRNPIGETKLFIRCSDQAQFSFWKGYVLNFHLMYCIEKEKAA
jgi:hypothetical protein